MVTVECSWCKKKIKRYPVHVRKHKNWFCSDKCESLFKRNIPTEKHPRYKGQIDRNGYWYIKKWNHPYCQKQGYIAVHRLVMEKKIGRYLKFEEVVHHINENKKDNRPENLQLVENRGKHIMNHHPKTWAKFQENAFRTHFGGA